MMNLSVAIVCSDTLSALGLNALLKDHFQLDASIITPEQHQLLADMALSSDFDFYIVDETVLIQHLNAFLPNRNKVIVLTATSHKQESDFAHFSRAAAPETIIATLSKSFKAAQKSSIQDNQLSSREIQVLKLVVAGKLNKEIANELNISINTVLTHRKNLTAKLGIKSVSGLSFYALMNGLVKP